MKRFFKLLISIVNTFYVKVFLVNLVFSNKTYYSLVNIKSSSKNQNAINFINSYLEKSTIHISGSKNVISANHTLISNSTINIKGSNNELLVDENAKIRSVIIHIKGNNCKVTIGKRTTFGGARIVNAGNNNLIQIGKDCLFSDNIEIWASDTHQIYNSSNVIINKEQPIVIEDKVWIGSKVTILKGVHIKTGSVIGIASVVTKDIEPNTISVGNPARKVKNIIGWKL